MLSSYALDTATLIRAYLSKDVERAHQNGNGRVTKRLLHYCIYSVFGLLVALLVLTAWLAARLAEGPLPLTFIVPVIERALNHIGAPHTFTADRLVMTWRGWHDGMDLSLVGIEVRAPGNPKPLLGVPELVLKLSSQAMRQWVIALEEVDAYGVQLRLERDADGHLGLGVPATDASAEGGDSFLRRLLAEIQAPPNPDDPASYLERVVLAGADLEMADLPSGLIWRARIERGSLARSDEDLHLAVDLDAELAAGKARLQIEGDARDRAGTIDLAVQIADLRPANLAALSPALTPLAARDLPLKGAVTLRMNADGGIERLGIDLAGGPGEIIVSEAIAAKLGDPAWAQRLAIDSAELRGSLSPPEESVSVETLSVAFAKDTTLLAPAPLNHRFPLRAVNAAIEKRADRIDVKALNLDLTGPKITAKATIEGLAASPVVTAEMAVRDLKMDEIRRYWPPSVAPGGLKWCAEHLSRGVVSMPTINLALADRGKGMEITTFNADIAAEGARVDYLSPLPTIEDARATATLDLGKLAIRILGGTSIGLQIEGGTVVITDFDKPVETIAINLALGGPLRSAVDVLSRKPLAYTEGIGLKPEEVSGNVAMRLQLGFPLLEALPIADVDLLATAEMTDATIVPGIAGIAVRDGQLRLRVDTNDLMLEGLVSLDGIPGRIIWEEHFSSAAKILTEVRFHADNISKPEIERAAPGLPVARVLKDGAIAADVTFVRKAKPPFLLQATFNLTNADLAIEELGWHKPAGVHSVVHAEAKFTETHMIAIKPVSAYGAGLVLDGAIDFDSKGNIEQIEVKRLISGRTEIAATIAASAAGWSVNIDGPSLDLEPMLATQKGGDETGTQPNEAPAKASIWLSADIGRVWTASNSSFSDVVGTTVREGSIWTLVQMQASGPQNSHLSATITPGDGETRDLRVYSDNAGAILQALDLYDTMRGGTLTISGQFDDAKAGHPLSGQVRVRNYGIVRAPVLARLLSILALTGIADALEGAGISFSILRAPFTYHRDTLTLNQAEANGPSLGITASGTLSMLSETVDVRGTIVPFFFINSALGRLPLIGSLFTGGQEGGGLFAASFTVRGPLEKPNVSVNPLSVFAPGFVRQILIFLENLFLPPSVPAEFLSVD